MPCTLIIDGVDVTKNSKGLEDLEIEYGFSNDNTYGYTTTTDITLENEAYDLIYDKFFTGCRPDQRATATFYDDCCDIPFQFDIEYEDVEICTDCMAKVTLTKIPDERRCYNYLETTVWYKKGVKGLEHGRMEYCKQGGFATQILYYIVPLAATTLALLFLICNIVKGVLFALSPSIRLVQTILSPLIGLIGGIFDGRDDFEYGNTKLKDLPNDITCAELLGNLYYSNEPINLAQYEIETICSTGEENCYNIIYPKMPEQGDDDREKLLEFCNYITLKYSLEESSIINNVENSDTSFFINVPCDWADPCGVYGLVRGCNNWIQVPLVLDVLKFHLGNCGLKLSAPPLEGQLWALFNLQADGGKELEQFENEYGSWVENANSTETVVELLNKLKETFNAEWIIKSGTLYFDRKDKIDALRKQFSTITKLRNENKLLNNPCVDYIQDNAKASWKSEYCQDSFEHEGNDISKYYGHGERIEWNSDNDHWKKGTEIANIPFAPARFMFDQITLNDKGLYNWNLTIDRFRKTGDGNLAQAIFGGGIYGILVNQVCEDPVDGALIISQADRTNCTKLLALDPTSPVTDRKVLRRPIGIRAGFTVYDYNYPFKSLEKDSNDIPMREGLYHEYHSVNDPNKPGREVFNMTDVELSFDCDQLRMVHENPCGWYIETSQGRGNIDKIKFSVKDKKCTLSGIKIRCQ